MKKIVFITSCIEGWGGSEELWAGAAERLRCRDFDLLAVRTRRPTRLSDGRARLAAAGIPMKEFRATYWVRWRLALQRWADHSWPRLSRRWRYRPFRRLFQAFAPELAVISQGDNYDGITAFTNAPEVCAEAGLPYVLICQKAYEDLWPPDSKRATVQRAFAGALRVFSFRNITCAAPAGSLPFRS